ncbi:MAG: TraB family protein, partial [Candidatus Nanohaloarchaea archaeon]
MKEKIEVNGKEITIVGTAHISQESRDEVRETIEDVRPDLVGVELDQSRFDSLRDGSGWNDLEISEAIRDGKGNLLLLNLILSIYQRKLGLEQGMKPGEELMAAVDKAEELGIEYELVDQDINKTLNRAISSLSIFDKLKLIASMIIPSDDEDIDVESLKDGDMLGTLINELEEEFPELKRVFLDERNTYMAEKLLEKDFESAVVVVGAAHVEGLKEELRKEKRQAQVEDVNRLPWMKIANYGFTALVVLGLGFSFYSSLDQGITNLSIWIGSNSILAFIGAVIA